MANQKKTQADRLLTRQDMGRLFNVRPEHFDKSYREFVPQDLIVKSDRRVLFKPHAVKAIVDALLEAEREKFADAGGDPLLAGGDSPGLERYRLAKAELAELDVAERQKQVVNVKDVEQIIGIVAARIRSLGDRMVKRFGKDARKMIDRSLDDAQKEIDARFGSSN